MNNVLEFIENLEIKNKCVVAAISGGPDSMLLLDILLSLREKLNIKIIVAHVHHNLRKESDKEKEDLENYCKRNNLIFEFKKIEKYPNNKFSEESARKIRYEFFDDIVKKYNAEVLFTAHHGDDLVETVLMKITRGSTIKGYAGFQSISTDRGYKIARPLIYLTKDEILEILNEKSIEYAVDMSNKNDKYTRNRYRNHLLPILKFENENIHLKYIDYSNKLLLADDYLRDESDKFLSNNFEFIDIIEFNKLHKIIKIYVLEKFLKEIYKNEITTINDSHVSLIIKYMDENKNTTFNLPLNKIGIIEYNKFKIIEPKEIDEYDYTFTDSVELPNGKKIVQDNDTKLTSNYVIHLNSNEIKLPFHVRTRKENDKMIVKNMDGSKKINDIFTDFKLPKELRDEYPIVTDATGEIIWIPGIKKSHLDRKKEQKYDIILKYE